MTSFKIYMLNIHILRYNNLTRIMNMINIIDIGVETPIIDSGCSLDNKFHFIDLYKSLNDNVLTYSMRLIHITILFAVLRLETPKTSYR